MNLSEQSVIFLLDDPSLLETERTLLIRCIRNCVHSLRGYSYSKKKHLSVGFATLSSQPGDDTAQTVLLIDFDTFSVKDELLDSYFKGTGFSALNYFFSTLQVQKNDLPLIIVLHSTAVDGQQNYQRLCSLSQFVSSKKVLAFKSDWDDVHKLIYSVQSVSLPSFDVASKMSVFVQSASQKKFFKPLLAGLGAALVVTLALLIIVPRVGRITNPFVQPVAAVYKLVYTGDGDRLILRDAPSRSGQDLLRLNEYEALQVVEENISDSDGELWDKVNYHGFEGYVHTEYLMGGSEEDYVITNPDTMYTYGKALLLHNLVAENDGYYWIRESAGLGEISAQWEMFKFYDNGAFPDIVKDPERAKEYLLAIDANENPYEAQIAQDCRKSASSNESAGYTELAQKFKAKAAEKEEEVKKIRRQAAKKLSQLYFDTDINLASAYYKKALSYGLSGDADYMYSLAVGTDLSDEESIWWLEKASALGHYKSTDILATFYWNRENYDEALKWFKAGVKQSDSAEPAFYCGWIYYHQYKNYSSAFSYFYTAYLTYDYSDEFYKSCYYLGWCYEYGQGTYESDSYALDYYNIARGHVSNADEAYSRVYKRLYGGWW